MIEYCSWTRSWYQRLQSVLCTHRDDTKQYMGPLLSVNASIVDEEGQLQNTMRIRGWPWRPLNEEATAQFKINVDLCTGTLRKHKIHASRGSETL